MSGEHFSGGQMPHEPISHLPLDIYEAVEKNVVYACTDVILRNPDTNKLFLGVRQTEPQLGPWLVGGRNAYGIGIDENASKQVANDLGIDIPKDRFAFIATYSTDFPVAAPGREEHGRHTMNATMLADLKPEEVAELNQKVAGSELRDEYSSGHWYSPSEIADPQSDFSFAIKQMVRDIYNYDLLKDARHEAALEDNREFNAAKAAEKFAAERKQRLALLSQTIGVNGEQAAELDKTAGNNATYGVMWARTVAEDFSGEPEELKVKLDEILGDEKLGDFQIFRKLRELGVARPEVFSDNGPTLRAILRGASLAIDYNESSDGELFASLGRLRFLGHPGPNFE